MEVKETEDVEIEEVNGIPVDVIKDLMDELGMNPAQAMEFAENNCLGFFANDREFAQETASNCIEGFDDNEVLARYFDYEAYAKDLLCDYIKITYLGENYYFWES